MAIVKYKDIIENCIHRTTADLFNIDNYIKRHKWEDIIIKRHHPFIQKYIDNNFNIIKAGKELRYSGTDMLSIFLRIESQFEIYEKNNTETIFKDLITSKNDIPNYSLIQMKDWERTNNISKKPTQLKKPDLKVEHIWPVINPQTGKTNKDKEVIRLIECVREMKNLSSIFGDNLSTYVQDLINGKTINQIGSERKRNTKYILTTILGVKKPRSKCEWGLQRILEKEKRS